MQQGVGNDFPAALRETEFAQVVGARLAVEPAQWPSLAELALSLQQWLAEAGQRAEAEKLMSAVRQLLLNDHGDESDRVLRNAPA